eukprot:15718933-Heterocapsa_arctica.AAC.1
MAIPICYLRLDGAALSKWRRAAPAYENLAIVVGLEPTGLRLPTTENREPPQCGGALQDALVKCPSETKTQNE